MKHLSVFFVLAAAFWVQPMDAQTPAAIADRAAARFLDQAAWGPTPASIAQLQQSGIANWLKAQFSLNTSDLPDQPMLDASTGKPNRDLTPVQAAFFQNAVTGQDQLRQRVAFALSQMWVVSAVSTKYAYAFPPYWRLFRDNAFGNYRDIMKALTLSPAMGNYLNMANNNKGNTTAGTSANENYARELMQLFTIGLTQLNPDGSAVLDSNKNPIPTYNQSVVTNTARALTGWTYPTAPKATAKANNPAYYIGQMFAVEAEHDTTSKSIIGGVTIPAGQTAEEDLDSVLDALLAQPTMAPFISKQLIQHLVTSNPSPAYIQRAANVFLDNGSGVRGDMKSVLTAILTDAEARAGDDPSSAPNPNFGHMREPVLFMANLLRGLNATLGSSSAIYLQASNLGEDLFNPPTVFSYFSPLYTLENGEPAPEFQIYSTQTATNRADIINTILYGALDKSTTINLTPFLPSGSKVSAMVDYISYAFLHHAMSNDLLEAASSAASAATGAKAQAQAALYIVLTSSEYQIVQ
ncbi:MAG: DUF1800 domain-containing protein [Bryobacteraceae bacterium]